MNEKIKELAKQAGFAYEPTNDQLWVDGPTEIMISPGLEKFAKLIIQECFTAIKNDDGYHLTVSTIDDRYNQGLQMGLEFAITDIAEHFGVEE